MPDDWLAAADLRGSVHKDIYPVLVDMEAAGWRFRQQGHGWRAYCGCDPKGETGECPIPHTPPNPGNAAKRLRRNISHCPGSHGLVK